MRGLQPTFLTVDDSGDFRDYGIVLDTINLFNGERSFDVIIPIHQGTDSSGKIFSYVVLNERNVTDLKDVISKYKGIRLNPRLHGMSQKSQSEIKRLLEHTPPIPRMASVMLNEAVAAEARGPDKFISTSSDGDQDIRINFVVSGELMKKHGFDDTKPGINSGTTPKAKPPRERNRRIQPSPSLSNVTLSARQGLMGKEISEVGGIDMNAAHLNMNIKRDGNGVPLPVSQQDLENIHIDGLVPEILDIRPVMSSVIFSQLMSPAGNGASG
jgi:hypothetical protein